MKLNPVKIRDSHLYILCDTTLLDLHSLDRSKVETKHFIFRIVAQKNKLKQCSKTLRAGKKTGIGSTQCSKTSDLANKLPNWLFKRLSTYNLDHSTDYLNKHEFKLTLRDVQNPSTSIHLFNIACDMLERAEGRIQDESRYCSINTRDVILFCSGC